MLSLHEVAGVYTRNWFFKRNLPTFIEYIHPCFSGKPTTYIEIGVFEGQSFRWMLDNVLTHRSCVAAGVDPWLEMWCEPYDQPFMDRVYERAKQNIHASTCMHCTLYRQTSAEFFRRFQRGGRGAFGIKRGHVDLIMIDGSHYSPTVADDAGHALQLLRPGGWLLFDDVEPRIKKIGNVKDGLAAFVAAHGNEVKQAWKHDFVECYEKL